MEPMRLHRHAHHAAPTLVLIHGLSSSHRVWQRNLAALARDYQVLTVQLFGWRSGWRFDVSEQATTLADAIADERRPVAMIGHSLGALVAMQLAMDHPDLVRRLVVMDVPALPPAASWPQRLSGLTRPSVLADARSLGVVTRTVLSSNPWQLMSATLAAARTDLGAVAPAIEVPTLIVWGEHDGIVPLEIGQRLTALMPNSRLEIIEGAAHQPQWEAPDAFHAAVLPFLAGP